MAYDRNLLAFKDIEAFQKWLDENQLAWRPGKGAHQIMQVALKDSWTAISVSEKKAVTTSPALREMIQRFKKGLPYTGKTPRIDKDTQVQLAESPDSFIEDLRDDFAIADVEDLRHRHRRFIRRVAQVLEEDARLVRRHRGLLVAQPGEAAVRVGPPLRQRGLADQLAAGVRVQRANLRRRVRAVIGVQRDERGHVVRVEGGEPRFGDRFVAHREYQPSMALGTSNEGEVLDGSGTE